VIRQQNAHVLNQQKSPPQTQNPQVFTKLVKQSPPPPIPPVAGQKPLQNTPFSGVVATRVGGTPPRGAPPGIKRDGSISNEGSPSPKQLVGGGGGDVKSRFAIYHYLSIYDP
jgi:hypothetical protein